MKYEPKADPEAKPPIFLLGSAIFSGNCEGPGGVFYQFWGPC